ncbi:MAG: PIN domain-containing protein [Candidatus Lokiarchaeota archaeon]|nr:PIN domain-containing protein [Candidatus Lokiarchaeota archaeon]
MKNIKPLILDTTFILPLFGIKIKIDDDFESDIKRVWKNEIDGYVVYLPSTCLIETVFKLLNVYKKTNDFNVLDRYQMILPTLLNLPINIFNCELNPKASMIASVIRHYGHPDFMDCWIAATAAVLNGIFLSEDVELKKNLKNIPETKNLSVSSWKEFKMKIKMKK